ncbi:DUF5058 domain-containing protein [Arthrobacter sp. MYb229]|uniref:DUF5058 family protein n=1 Tax=unclassified Arthrobacter TaxID=235627 RepID=UPI000CFD26EA|nr:MULTISPECIES: DUF5058 family protein [unclassified Arthrobacter]PRA07095.1 DUF5058 domain-containing protein [Arthrobacter sp. MYb229]PRB53892.1 DUF5058 domain-containing protein [Arthrobacter sp. MYb216]
MYFPAVVDNNSTDILAVANSPVLWACAVGVFLVIVLQSIIYMKAAKIAAPHIGMSQAEIKRSFNAGAISALGPSLAVVMVAVALLTVFGTPAVLVRIGLIGSVSYETAAAAIAVNSTGAELGGPTYTQAVFGLALAAMSLGGAMWMIATLVLTPLLKRGDSALRKVNPAIMMIVPGAAMVAAFMVLGIGELPKSWIHVVAFGSSAVIMTLLMLLAKRVDRPWIKEWALGIAIILSLAITHLATRA